MSYTGRGTDLRSFRNDVLQMSLRLFAQRLDYAEKYLDLIESNTNPVTDRLLDRIVRAWPAEGAAFVATFREDGTRSAAYEYERVAIVVRFREGRRPDGTLEYRHVRALQDGVERIQVMFSRGPMLSRPSYETSFGVEYGGEVESVETQSRHSGFARAVVRLADPPLRKGEERMLFCTRRYLGGDEPLPYWRYLPNPTTASARNVSIAVEFAPDAVPARVWRFSQLSDWDIPGTYSAANALTPNRHRAVEASFSEPQPHLSHGIGWEWD